MNLKNIKTPIETELPFHISFREFLDTFRYAITANTWFISSIDSAKNHFEEHNHLITLACSFNPNQKVHIDKTIFNLVETENPNQISPMFSKTMINFYRIITIALKDIIWNEDDFQKFLEFPEFQYFRHIRNASAHYNSFFWGTHKKQRELTIKKLPVTWRDKTIEENIEGRKLYMDFMQPGDLFILLSDITKRSMSSH